RDGRWENEERKDQTDACTHCHVATTPSRHRSLWRASVLVPWDSALRRCMRGGAAHPRAPHSWMAYDLKGDLGEEVTDDPLFARSPTADPRDRPAGRGLLAPDRAAVPGQPLLRRATVADLPPHRLDPTPTPSRRKPRQTPTG